MLQRFLDWFLEPVKLLSEAPVQPAQTVEEQEAQEADEDIRLMSEELDRRFQSWYPEMNKATRRTLINGIVKEVA